jgi:hypothetical protein
MEKERGITITKTINEIINEQQKIIITNPYQNLNPLISNNKITKKTNKTPKKIKRK